MAGTPERIVKISGKLQTSFYDSVSEYGILPLEMTERSMLSDIMKIRVYDERIFLLSGYTNTKLMVFDKEGKFVAEVGRRGRGPQEHIELGNFEIDPTRNELILLDREGLKLLIFDFDGNFRQEVKIPTAPECAGRLSNGNFVLVYTGYQIKLNDYYVLVICDENGQVLERHIENQIHTSINISAREMMTAQADGSLSLMPQYHNMLYRVTDKGITAGIGFEIPGETITVDNFNQNFTNPGDFFRTLKGKNYMPGNHAENDRYVFFYNKGLEDLEHVFYNKTNGESLRVSHPLFGTSVFIDDQDCCWANVNEASLTLFKANGNDELTNTFMKAFDKYENIPLIFYRLKI